MNGLTTWTIIRMIMLLKYQNIKYYTEYP